MLDLHPLVLGLAAAMTMMSALWLWSLRLEDVSIVDIFWGLGFVLAAAVYHLSGDGDPLRMRVVLGLVAVWGLRLSWHLFRRNWGEEEDYRYREMREKAGSSFRWRSLVTVFWLQAALLWIVALPLWAAQDTATPPAWTGWDVVGVVLFGIGFTFEAVGDYQLQRFKADPDNRGKVLDSGLWRYTRHPNYFGDAVLWWGFAMFAVAVDGRLWTLIGPVVMTVLLMKVSGVALLEKRLSETKPKYADYVRRTNAFFPWFPKS